MLETVSQKETVSLNKGAQTEEEKADASVVETGANDGAVSQMMFPIKNFSSEPFVKGRILGHGAFGAVYSVQLLSNGGTYAMKKMLLNPHDSEERKAAIIKAVEREIQILEKLRHPNIIRYVGYLYDADSMCLFMEMLDGSLWGVIQQKQQKRARFKLSEILRFLSDISTGLDYLHSNNVAHRDLKVRNFVHSNF
jgi:serine/threonine protein kinase